jgi:hypothetical protein
MSTPEEPVGIKPGVERWAVKTGTDPEAANVSLTPVTGSIAMLVALTPPPDPDTVPDRVDPTELTVFEFDTTLIAYKLEQDGDYHLVLSDGANTMIAEIPDPDFCQSSIWLPAITSARDAFNAQFGNQVTALKALAETLTEGVPMITKVSVPVTVQGVGFFDRLHGQTGVAPNGCEVHPILNIIFPAAA